MMGAASEKEFEPPEVARSGLLDTKLPGGDGRFAKERYKSREKDCLPTTPSPEGEIEAPQSAIDLALSLSLSPQIGVSFLFLLVDG